MKSFRKSIALFLCLLLLPLFPVHAEDAEELSPELEQSVINAIRFGVNARVESDASGEVTRVNGYPVHTVRAGFNSVGHDSTLQYESDFVEYPFWNDATKYDGNLAAMSLVMALSANRAEGYSDIRSEKYDPSLNVIAYLEDAGFSDIRKDDYSRVPTMYTVSTAIGSRIMRPESGEGEPFTLIAAGVCGAGYNNEWMSNLSPGSGPVHEGFLNAAGLLVDRISGYIATRGIQGPVKVWISGFSRAAAVSNLAAGILVDRGVFPKENVFAYTFATPAAVQNPPDAGYENIFNILSPVDLIPQFMPSDWEFGRYGTDLFLPTQEFSSFFGEYAQEIREETNRLFYGVESNHSAALNFRERLLFSLLLNLVDSRENYNALYQPTMADILSNRNVPSSLTAVRSLMLNLRGSTQDKRSDLDELIDYSVRVLISTLTRSGYGNADRNAGSAFLRLFTEHKDNAYLACISFIRNNQFEANDTAWYVLVKGPVSVIARLPGEPVISLGITSDGKAADESVPGVSRELVDGALYMDRLNGVTVAAIPADMPWAVRWAAEKDGEVECLLLRMKTAASIEYEVYTAPKRSVRAGDTADVLIPEGGSAGGGDTTMPVEGLEKQMMEARQVAEFLGIASVGLNWRIALMLAVAVIGGILFAVICLVFSRNPHRRKRYRFPVWLLLCVFGISVMEAEAAYWFFADRDLIRLLWKGAAALSLLGVHFLTRVPKSGLLHSCLPALLAALAADIAVSLHPLTGILLLILFHALLCVRFLRTSPLAGKQWIQWALAALLCTGLFIFLRARSYGAAGWAAAALTPVQVLTIFAALRQPPRPRLSAFLFLLAEFFLSLTAASVSSPVLHIAWSLLFSIALLLLALTPGHRFRKPELCG